MKPDEATGEKLTSNGGKSAQEKGADYGKEASTRAPTDSSNANLTQAFGRNQISVQVSGFRIWSLLTPHMKLNGTIPNKAVNSRDTISGVEVFRNIKFQEPISKETPNLNIQ